MITGLPLRLGGYLRSISEHLCNVLPDWLRTIKGISHDNRPRCHASKMCVHMYDVTREGSTQEAMHLLIWRGAGGRPARRILLRLAIWRLRIWLLAVLWLLSVGRLSIRLLALRRNIGWTVTRLSVGILGRRRRLLVSIGRWLRTVPGHLAITLCQIRRCRWV